MNHAKVGAIELRVWVSYWEKKDMFCSEIKFFSKVFKKYALKFFPDWNEFLEFWQIHSFKCY